MRKLERPIDPPPCLEELDSEFNQWSDVDKAQIWSYFDPMQHGFCCYCEKVAIKGNGHIEHFYHKGKKGKIATYQKLTFDWNNLFGCCGSEFSDTCGHYKDSGGKKNGPGLYDPQQIIKPDIDDPTVFFCFTNEGEILVKDTLNEADSFRAQETIRVLRLDFEPLVDQRKRLIDRVRSEYELIFNSSNDGAILEQDLSNLIESIKSHEFQTAVLDVYNLSDQ
ncbi:TIGR02646 family protein [Marinomonas primoryensis]|uniref:TIGR02646 family protein n=1 Tax=Marinomonas primoryensis TaxID=178399 RepID=A0A2Z4PMS5_9GAMM|nr:retron Ec78 anti-phage system effector HNH endonuclease PtuB [Marinomonas primoryensis]AWX98801.1 TIGR02646 family protein [Marinomonas primoryensis]